MSLKLPIQTSESVAIQHKITAGGQFDGTTPAGEVTAANYTNKFPASAAGGLFWFENTKPIVVHTARADFGSSIAHTLSVVNVDATGAPVAGEEIVILSATAQYMNLEDERVTLMPGQALKLVTTGGTQAMFATVAAMLEISFRG